MLGLGLWLGLGLGIGVRVRRERAREHAGAPACGRFLIFIEIQKDVHPQIGLRHAVASVGMNTDYPQITTKNI